MRKLALALAIVLGLSFVLAGCDETGTTGGGERPSVRQPEGPPPRGGRPPGMGGAPEGATGRPAGDVDPSVTGPGAEDATAAKEGSEAK